MPTTKPATAVPIKNGLARGSAMNAISTMAAVTNAPVRLPDTVKSLSKIPSETRLSLFGIRIMIHLNPMRYIGRELQFHAVLVKHWRQEDGTSTPKLAVLPLTRALNKCEPKL